MIGIEIEFSAADTFLFSVGLDEISSEKETLEKQRKAAAKATEELRKKLPDEDEDYEPKLTPGLSPRHPSLNI